MIDVTINEVSEETKMILRDGIKKEIKTTFARENDGWTIHCEFLGEAIEYKHVHDTELEENEIIEQFYTNNIEPELIDLLLSGQHVFPFKVLMRIVQN